MSAEDKEKLIEVGKVIHGSTNYLILLLISIVGWFIIDQLNDIKEDRKASWNMINSQTKDITGVKADMATIKQRLADHIEYDEFKKQKAEVDKFLNEK